MKTLFTLFATIIFTACTQSGSQIIEVDTGSSSISPNTEYLQLATFAGGCFWCMEKPFESVAGVTAVVSGFSGGTEINPAYSQVSAGQTTHKESVQLQYDPAIVSYEELLHIFWRQINPTDAGGQFADRGPQYATAIFYHTEEQKLAAQASKKALEASGKFTQPVVTELSPYTAFYSAEEYHQDYYTKNPYRYSLYFQGSGRADYIQQHWAEDTTLY